MAFGTFIFMASLKKHIDNYKRLAFKGFATYNSESFTTLEDCGGTIFCHI
jgi:hypothetical protein